jgi:hypothetical protein
MTTTTVRIATYNLWWASENQRVRLDAAADLLDSLDADVIALQEVAVRGPFAWESTRYPHTAFRPEEDGEDEGLGIISKHPLRNVVIGDDPAIRCSIDVNGVALNLTNLHLDWQRGESRSTDRPHRRAGRRERWLRVHGRGFQQLSRIKRLRWAANPTLELPARCDWILLRDTFEQNLPKPRLIDAGVFGVEAPGRHDIVPSDHYGVMVDLKFEPVSNT